MKALKEFTIPFVGLKLGEHQFNFQIHNQFFEHFDYEDFNGSDIKLNVRLDKKTTLLEFTLFFDGSVNVQCDITDEPFDQHIEGSYHFLVKFGEEYDDTNDDLLILPHGSYEVNIQQFIYETLILALPAKRVHPGVGDGTLKSDILKKLEELKPKIIDDGQETLKRKENTDPRWDTLKKLLTDK